MRSQLFGFIVESHLLYELALNCTQQQAVSAMKQQLIEFEAITPTLPAHQTRLIHYLSDPFTCAFEAFLCEWDEEITETVHAITAVQALNHERLRMQELKRALSWLWPKVRATAVIGQFVLATTIDNTLLLTATFGWNEGASVADREMAATFMPCLVRKLELLGYEAQLITKPLVSANLPNEKPLDPIVYGPRPDTLEKLESLVTYRQSKITLRGVSAKRLKTIQSHGLALRTVKKYAPLLYKHWYDPTFAGGIY